MSIEYKISKNNIQYLLENIIFNQCVIYFDNMIYDDYIFNNNRINLVHCDSDKKIFNDIEIFINLTNKIINFENKLNYKFIFNIKDKDYIKITIFNIDLEIKMINYIINYYNKGKEKKNNYLLNETISINEEEDKFYYFLKILEYFDFDVKLTNIFLKNIIN